MPAVRGCGGGSRRGGPRRVRGRGHRYRGQSGRLPEAAAETANLAASARLRLRIALAKVSDACPWLTVQLMPFGSGAPHDGEGMTILRFAQMPSLGVVHLPGLKDGHCLDGPGDIAGHVLAFTQLQVGAISPARSARMLLDMAAGLGHGATAIA